MDKEFLADALTSDVTLSIILNDIQSKIIEWEDLYSQFDDLEEGEKIEDTDLTKADLREEINTRKNILRSIVTGTQMTEDHFDVDLEPVRAEEED